MKTKFVLIWFILTVLIVRDDSAQTILVGGDSLPAFHGGDKALVRFLQKHTRYPAHAKKEEIKGTVIVTFNVDYLGNMRDIHFIQKVSPELDKEALRVISLLEGRWEPAERVSEAPAGNRIINFKFGIP
jgi:TonB family protein